MGFGARIMDELERDIQGRGFRRFVLPARVSAVRFHKKPGYAVTSEEFMEVTILHARMEKMFRQTLQRSAH